MNIYEEIQNAVKAANIKGIVYQKGFPRDYIYLKEELSSDNSNTLAPLIKALEVILNTIKEKATSENDLEINFSHLPSDELWEIYIGDGR